MPRPVAVLVVRVAGDQIGPARNIRVVVAGAVDWRGRVRRIREGGGRSVRIGV